MRGYSSPAPQWERSLLDLVSLFEQTYDKWTDGSLDRNICVFFMLSSPKFPLSELIKLRRETQFVSEGKRPLALLRLAPVELTVLFDAQ